MAELIDFLFFFWFLIAIGVYVIGSIYENHLKEKQRLESKRQKRLESISRVDDWRPNYTSSTSQTSHQVNSSHQQYNDNDIAAASNHRPINSASYLYTNPYDTSSRSYLNEAPSSSAPIRQTDFDLHDTKQREATFNYTPQSSVLSLSGDRSIPTATGFNSDCVDWVNRILFLFYSQASKYGPIIADNIYRSLNEKLSNILSSSMEFNDWMLEFTSVDLNLSTKPELKNVRTESESDKSVSAVCKIYNQRLVCHLKLQKARLGSNRGAFTDNLAGDNLSLQQRTIEQPIEYELTLESIEGKLKSVAMITDKLIVVQFMEKPDTKILLRQIKGINSNQSAGGHLRSAMNEDTLVSLILQALTQVVVDLYFGDDPDFPQFLPKQSTGTSYKNKLSQLKGSANEIKRQIKHDFLGALNLGDNKERKILVKLMRAKNINYNQDVTCIMELDHPKQQAISSTKQGSNPFWDEHYLFLVNEKTSNDKLTVELWDTLDQTLIKSAKQQLQQDNSSKHHKGGTKSSGGSQKLFNKDEITASGKFLGMICLAIDDLRQNPVQKQTIKLQSAKSSQEQQSMTGGMNFDDSIRGELELELMFLEHSNSSSNHATVRKSASASSISSLATGGDQGDVVSVDRKLTSSGYLITTTTIAKPASSVGQLNKQRASSRDRLSPSGLSARDRSPVSSATEQSHAGLMEVSSLDGLSTQISQRSGDQMSQQMMTDDRESRSDSRLSRPRSRSRGFLRAIKRRFSFSRNRRSRSVSESASPTYSRSESQSALGRHQRNNMDAISIDSRSRASSEVSISGRAKSMPASRDSNEVPTIVINKSRLSDASSAFTFAQPKSQLVIECREPKMSGLDGSSKNNSLLRHYAIPDDPVSERRWRRRGLKLHLFNEHQFVACHLAGSSTCHLCGRVFSRRPGKQGYKCRNCHLLSHKQCHVKVDHNCPYATKDSLKLEYIDADPPASLVFERNQSAAGSQQQKPTRPTSRLAMKSISVEVDDR